MAETHALDRLFAIIAARQAAGDATASYTAKLISQGVEKCAKKFGEEAIETALAAVSGDKKHLAAESADVLYHLLVLWAAAGIKPEDVYAELEDAGTSIRLGRKGRAQELGTGLFLGQTFHQIQHALAHFGILIFMKASESCSPSVEETNSITGALASPTPSAGIPTPS